MMFYQEFSPAMQKAIRWLAFLLLLGIVFSAFAFGGWYLTSAKNLWKSTVPARQISVSGEGKVAVKPDIATLNAGIVSSTKKVSEAQRENSAKSSAVVNFLKKQGVEEKDIKTVGYNIYPQYKYSDVRCLSFPCPPQGPPQIVSYEVRHTLEIKVRSLDKTDDILEGIVSAGANEVGSINFGVDNDEAVRAEARKKAIEDAEKKARVLAKDLGVRLGRITGFSEGGGGFPIFARALEAKGGFGGDVAPSPEVQPGEQEIVSNVTITYEFR